MKNLRQVFLGIIIGLASIALLLGGFSLSLAEGKMASPSTPTPTLTLVPTQTQIPTSSPTGTTGQTLTHPTQPSTPSQTWTLTWTPTLPPTPTNCPPPVGWVPYLVQPGDTLDKVAGRFRTTSAALQQANCLLTKGLLPGIVIYIPPVPTQTPVPCGPPFNWIRYFVQPGDTLYRLSMAYGVTVAQLQTANCMGYSTLLHTGQMLYLPPGAATPYPTIPYPYPTIQIETLTSTLEPYPSDTLPAVPTQTPIPPASDTPTDIPTETPVP